MASKRLIVRPDDKLDREIATGSGAMAPVTFTPVDVHGDATAARIKEIRIHLDSASATSEDLTIYIDSASGSEYDVNVLTQDMDTVQDFSRS